MRTCASTPLGVSQSHDEDRVAARGPDALYVGMRDFGPGDACSRQRADIRMGAKCRQPNAVARPESVSYTHADALANFHSLVLIAISHINAANGARLPIELAVSRQRYHV